MLTDHAIKELHNLHALATKAPGDFLLIGSDPQGLVAQLLERTRRDRTLYLKCPAHRASLGLVVIEDTERDAALAALREAYPLVVNGGSLVGHGSKVRRAFDEFFHEGQHDATVFHPFDRQVVAIVVHQ